MRHLNYCLGSNKFIGGITTLATSGPHRLVRNPAYVEDDKAKCERCKRVIGVTRGYLARHKPVTLKTVEKS